MVEAIRVVCALGLGLLVAIGPPSVGGPLPANGEERRSSDPSHAPVTFADVARAARPAVVTLRLPGPPGPRELPVEDWVGDDEFEEETGAAAPGPSEIFSLLEWRTLGVAVIVDSSGVALTTARIVRLAPALEAVTLDGRRLQTTIAGLDERSNLAVLRLRDGARGFPSLALADSDRIRTGDWVLAVGAPFGLEGSVTAGVISATAQADDTSALGALLQTDASITTGYAGGPLVNTAGEVVGLTVGGDAGLGFAIPSNEVKKVYVALLERGRVSRGWLGISVQPLTPDLAHAFGTSDPRGVLISDVAPESPAALARLRPGDIVRELDGKKLEGRVDIGRVLGDATPGQAVTLKLWRHERDTTASVTLGEEPDEQAPGSVWSRARRVLGFDVRSITSDMGVVVGRVELGSPAARGGLQRGDVIRELNHQPVGSMIDFERALRNLKGGAPVLVLLQRGPASLYVTFTSVSE